MRQRKQRRRERGSEEQPRREISDVAGYASNRGGDGRKRGRPAQESEPTAHSAPTWSRNPFARRAYRHEAMAPAGRAPPHESFS